MAFSSGKDGRLYIDGQSAAKVIDWSITTSVTGLDTTTLGDLDKTNTAGIRSTSGTCDLFYYAADPNDTSTNSASVLLNKIIKAGSSGQGSESEKVLLRLGVVDGSSTEKYIEGLCLITSAAMTMSVGAVLSASISFEFDGAPRSMYL